MSREIPFGFSNLIRRLWIPFARDRRGTTAVEFSMISIPFLGLLFAIFQTSYLFMTQQAIDAAAAAASRNIMTGQTMSNSVVTESSFRTTIVCPVLASYLTCSNVLIDVHPASTAGTWSSEAPNSATNWLTATRQFCIGSTGDIVIVRLIYPVPAYLSIMTLSKSMATGGIGHSTAGQKADASSTMMYPIIGVSAFKNEPFPANAAYVKPAGC